MIYTPALPRPAVRLMVGESVIILCLFATAPVFLVNAWPAPALALGMLIILRSNWPPEPLAWAGLLAGLAAVLGAALNGVLAAGMIWWVVILLLTTASLQRFEREPALFAIVTAAAIHAVYGPISTAGPRLAGWLGNPNVYASFMAICLPLAVAGRQWLFAAVIAGGLILSGSVGGVLAAGAGLAALAFQTSRVRAFLCSNWKLAAVAVVIGMMIAWPMVAPRWDRRSNRLVLWELALRQTMIAPLAGTGPGSTPVLWSSWIQTTFVNQIPTGANQLIGSAWWAHYTHAHNLYLHVLAETGIIGLLALAVVFVYVAYNVRGPALAGLAALAVHGFVDATALHPVIAILAAMLIGIGSPRETRPVAGAILIGLLMIVLAPVAGGLLARLYGAGSP